MKIELKYRHSFSRVYSGSHQANDLLIISRPKYSKGLSRKLDNYNATDATH